ncbi:enoyl-CoA hydratase-related protein [Corynebacterium pseudodiphtheriticum]|uniref:enoyl-CoA hydratase-related protein n=1 Tax=Corynebacterium pseudodiphtheriticum TaxID=37637 RepID=UPI00254FBF6D|nr:enoyl-CoA hydratase-related protein [Corynebacterium pseudodiphtheriticum]MDK8487590.1 enoyl-CoA hydratase-related protein [Corynebacterium pseudodiphtheriticum]MDK8494824.1 enoyl-CoA hydratase-related protein [Corynebacterium pseudodiphtheriticum]MDK8500764.1 enoyl-CoA hydratase-related protein [Corynebacterium pseudodiphtheriticum]
MSEQPTQQLVQQEIADNLAIITLNNPDKRNALTHTAFGEVAKAITDAAAERSVRAIVITGAGAHFCSGLDLTAGESLTGASDEQIQASMGELNAMIRAVVEAEVPVIAAVEGAAAGVGASLALACDLVVAAQSAFFVLPFGRIGLLPDGGVMQTLSASLGRAVTMRMALLQQPLPAPAAQSAGLLAELADDGAALAVARECAAVLHNSSPEALAATKRGVNAACLGQLSQALEDEAVQQPKLLRTDGHREGVQAFVERRAPRF